MIYILAILLPFLAVLFIGRIFVGFILLLLQLTVSTFSGGVTAHEFNTQAYCENVRQALLLTEQEQSQFIHNFKFHYIACHPK